MSGGGGVVSGVVSALVSALLRVLLRGISAYRLARNSASRARHCKVGTLALPCGILLFVNEACAATDFALENLMDKSSACAGAFVLTLEAQTP